MHDRLDDLFILDAEQAAKELLIYGEGRSDQPIDRLSGTTAYLAPLLQSCGLLRHADACLLFTELFEVADEGQIRRLIREFAELTIHALEALRAGATISELGDDEAFEQLFSRLRPYSTNPGQSQRAPTPSRFRQLDSSHTDPDRELIANAFRAIEAVDSLATMIAIEVQNKKNISIDHQDFPSPVGQPSVDALHDSTHAEQGALKSLPLERSSTASLSQDVDPSAPIALSPAHGEDFEFGAPEPKAKLQSQAEWAGSNPHHPTEGDASSIREVSSKEVDSKLPAAVSANGPEVKNAKSRELMFRREILSVEVDAAFRKALRLANEGPWAQGMTALLESIDVLDHVALREAIPTELQLLGSHEILVQPNLAIVLGQELRHAQVAGVGDAMLVSQTLILAIQLDRFLPSDRLAKQIAVLGGRIEVDTALKRWRIVVPASARLLRVTQLKVDGAWLAVPWAQFLGVEGKGMGQEAQLFIGNESDRLRIEALGLVSTGVRFELARALRRRERYRGLVMLANAECLPIHA